MHAVLVLEDECMKGLEVAWRTPITYLPEGGLTSWPSIRSTENETEDTDPVHIDSLELRVPYHIPLIIYPATIDPCTNTPSQCNFHHSMIHRFSQRLYAHFFETLISFYILKLTLLPQPHGSPNPYLFNTAALTGRLTPAFGVCGG